MEFGKLKSLSGIDLTLPPDDPATRRMLAGDAPPRIFAGCPIWQDDAMARKLCPPGTPKSARLACYARSFNALELNSTGYGIDTAKVRTWAAEVPPGFRFCPKVPRDVSHAGNLDAVGDRYAHFCAAAEGFGEHLGPALLQFADSFGPSQFPALERFLRAHARRLPVAVEVRHPAWFAAPGFREKLFGLFEALGVVSVINDTPGRRDVLHQRITAPAVLIRFNGFALGEADFARLAAWAERLAGWRGLREAYFFTHLDPKHYSADLAARFLAECRAAGLAVAVPELREPGRPAYPPPGGTSSGRPPKPARNS